MGILTRKHKQFIDLGDHSETIIESFYYPQSDRATCSIKQINYDNLKIMTLEDTEIKTLIAIYQELKFNQEIKKEKKEASFCYEIWDKSGNLIAVIDPVLENLSDIQMNELMKIFRGESDSESYYHVEAVDL